MESPTQIISLFPKSCAILELPAVLRMLSAEAVSDAAKELCASLTPSPVPEEVRRRIGETDAAVKMSTVRGNPSFSGLTDISSALSRAELGGALSTRELLKVAGVLRCVRVVKSYLADDSVGHTSIDYLFASLKPNRFLEDRITTAIPSEDEISDFASSDLTDIRRKMRAASARAREALQKVISSPSYAKALQEPIITTRSDRFVVPVKSECKNQIPGLVHDVSSTGATLFVEPMAAVKANNELRELAALEKLEIERILMELSTDCAEHAPELKENAATLTHLDFIFAKARLSYKMEALPAAESDAVNLRRARHPLIARDKVVPIDVEVGGAFHTLIVTGPNTGGKTVCLKTIGLLAAMNQCGLHIPAGDGSTLPVFRSILADIGDEQSIEQNLSTFSAHMKTIVSVLSEADDRSLILFDELGAGTDPSEGAALAISVIEAVRSRGAMTIATTHYTELKIYAINEPGVQNASCEFDVETLRPTYRLLLGVPGKSNAFAISKRLGLPEEIIDAARSRLSSDSTRFEATIENLEKTRNLLETEREEAARLRRESAEEAKKARALRAELSVRLEKADVKARREAEQILQEARDTAAGVYRELDEMRADAQAAADRENAAEENSRRADINRRLKEAQAKNAPTQSLPDLPEKSARDARPGDMVKLRTHGLKAEVIAVNPDGTLLLMAGSMNLTAKQADVVLLQGEKPQKPKTRAAATTQIRPTAVSAEIDLRGMESLEAVAATENYLDAAVMGRLSQVTVIHGKGTGALRKAIHAMLKTNKHVKSYRLGLFGEGESGVTIVELK